MPATGGIHHRGALLQMPGKAPAANTLKTFLRNLFKRNLLERGKHAEEMGLSL